jgi:prepilin-type processing-associated H-X9-DG protein
MLPPLYSIQRVGPRATAEAMAADKRNYSVFSSMLPFLDEPSLFNSTNFLVYADDPFNSTSPISSWPGFQANSTVMSVGIATLLCPADGAPKDSGAVSYRASLGTERWHVSRDGPFMYRFNQCTSADIVDGLSQTVAFGEKLRGRMNGSTPNLRTDLLTGARGLPYTLDEVIETCTFTPLNERGFTSRTGLTWFVGSLSQTCYNHVMEPNPRIPDCVSWTHNPFVGIVSSRSNHDGGVNAMWVDGSVRFVSESINRQVWRAIGSRNGGEVVTY